MRRALRDLRNIHGRWVRRGRRCVRRFHAGSLGCCHHLGRRATNSLYSEQTHSGQAMPGLHPDTIASVVLSRLFFYLIPVQKLCPQPVRCRGPRVVLHADR